MKHGRPIIWFLISLVAVLLFDACKTPARLAYRNIAPFYNPGSEFKGLDYAIFNVDDSLTRLYLSFPYHQLKYVREDGMDVARFRFSYQLYDGYENSKLMDSASFYGMDSLARIDRFFDSIALRLYRGKTYMLNVELTDLRLKKSYGAFLAINKTRQGGDDDYLLVNANNLPLMRNYVLRNEVFRIRSAASGDALSLVISERVSAPAISPYQFPEKLPDFTNDSSFSIGMENNVSETFKLSCAESCFLRVGKTLQPVARNFYDGFPEIGSVEEMRESLRYITTDAEFREIQRQPARAAVDDFWVKVTGHPERALQQIKSYYSRVEETNRFFTLSGEGWKSDRGMIYIVYGPPNVVYKNAVSEEWTYGEAGNPMSVRFMFNLKAVSDNLSDYILDRSDTYRSSWHLAVSNWRR